MNKLYPFEPTLPIPPGETIRMILEHLGMTQAELATRLGYSRKYVNQLLHGVVAVTPEAAVKLEAVLGPPASFWNSAEQSYRELRAKAEQEDALRGQLGLAKLMPYNELAKLGRVPDTRKALERARNLLGFFAVASLDTVEVQYEAAFRHAQSQDPSPYALACWLRLGELEALGRDVARYDEGGLKRALPRLRKLSVISTTSFQDELTAILARNGVILVLMPHLPKTYANGATRWLSDSKALVQLSIRGSYADIFWFSLFHELGHLLLKHSRRKLFIAGGEDADADEKAADQFASDTLIPPKPYVQFLATRDFGADAVCRFAKEQGVHPGIVVGRLHHEKLLQHSALNYLRVRLRWAIPPSAPDTEDETEDI